MDKTEIWKEICFLLSYSIKPDISEKDYENQVIRAIEKLGWREYTGEIKRQPELKVGRSMTIRPDVAIYGLGDEALIMIEVKRPAERLSKEEPSDQLISYMLQAQSDFGLLIGSSIRLFYNGKGNPQRRPLLLDRIPFESNSEKGLRFVSIFNRNDFFKSAYKPHITELIDKFTAERNIKKLKEILLQKNTKAKILDFLKDEYSEYGSDVIDGALSDLKIKFSFDTDAAPDSMPSPEPPEGNGDGTSLLKTVFDTINRYPDGISKAQLLQVTGFSKRQISNLIYKLSKRGAIESKERGIYKVISETIPPRKKKKTKPRLKPSTAPREGTIRQGVYEEIKKYPKGCTKQHLMSTLGLKGKQLSNVIHRLTKKGLIQSIDRGLYIIT